MSTRPVFDFNQPLPEPPGFDANLAWKDARYVYRYDAKRKLGKRSPLKVGDSGGGYFAAALAAPQSRPTPEVAPSIPPQPAPVAPDPAPVVAQTAAEPKPARPRKQISFSLPRLPRLKVLPSATNLRRTLSTSFAILFIGAAAVFLYPLTPELSYQLHQSKFPAQPATAEAAAGVDQPVGQTNRVIIPKVGIDTEILEGASLNILNQKEGVWHQAGELDKGNFVLAGHRFKYLPPNTSTLYNLDKLAVGDTIIVDWGGKRNVYVIKDLESVPVSQNVALAATSTPRITIYTCSDKLQTHRTVAVAEPL